MNTNLTDNQLNTLKNIINITFAGRPCCRRIFDGRMIPALERRGMIQLGAWDQVAITDAGRTAVSNSIYANCVMG